jgi:hypothetical protein
MNVAKRLVVVIITLIAGAMFWGCKGQNLVEEKNIDKAVATKKPESTNETITKFLSTDYQVVYKTEEIPKNVQNILLKRFSERELINPNLANPNEEFNATDFIEDPNIPRRRLVFAGLSPDSWFVCYEHGGRGKHCHLVIFSVKENRVQLNFNGTFFYKPADVTELKQWVYYGEVTDDTKNGEY